MQVKVLNKESLLNDFFQVDAAVLQHEKFDGGWSAPVRRLNLDRGEAVAVLIYLRDVQRWPNETFYRDAKQNLGLENCEMRILRGVRRHWDLVFLAYTLLQIESMTGPLSKWLKSNAVTIREKCRWVHAEIFHNFIFWLFKNYTPDVGIEKLFKPIMKGRQLEFKFY